MNTPIIIGAVVIAAAFVVWHAAQPAAAPLAPPKPPCGVPVSSHGTTVVIPCSVIKTVATAPVNVTRGVISAVAGTNPKVGLFGQATGATHDTRGLQISPGVRGVAA